jgi:uncharacterized protein YjbJ (UPF0337 family)
MGIDEKADNKAEELQGKGKEAIVDATDNKDLQAKGPAQEAKAQSEASQREGKGRVQGLIKTSVGVVCFLGRTVPFVRSGHLLDPSMHGIARIPDRR